MKRAKLLDFSDKLISSILPEFRTSFQLFENIKLELNQMSHRMANTQVVIVKIN